MSHERTITIEADGRHHVIPTVVDGKQLSAEEASRRFMQGKIKPFITKDTREEADKAARERSQNTDPAEVDNRLFGGHSDGAGR